MGLPAIAAKALPLLSHFKGAGGAANAAGIAGAMMPGAGGQGAGGMQPPGMQAFQQSVAGRVLSQLGQLGQAASAGVGEQS
jgi:hypothetical protein